MTDLKRYITIDVDGQELEYLVEYWADVKDYEGLYKNSSGGRVKSINYNQTKKEQVLKTPKDKYGYLCVCLYKDGKAKHHSVHRLVAEAFIPNPNNLPQVNHKDEDKTNNCLWNLEWCDAKYNINYGTRNYRAAKSRINHPLKSTPVNQFDLQGHFIKRWPSQSEVKRELGFSQSAIQHCCAGIRKTAYGYIWKYVQKMKG